MLKRLLLIVLVLSATSIAKADVFVRVCLADGNTPLEPADPCIPLVYRPIMVGSHLVIIINSDTGEYWGGGLYISDPWRDNGELFGRDPDGGDPCDWTGSHLEAAGSEATVVSQQDDFMSGFELSDNDGVSTPGDWFVIDYNALSTGDCNVGLYDYDFDFGEPNYVMSFTQVPTRDFDDDGIVSFSDFDVLGLNWRRTDCQVPDNCSGTDLDNDGNVNYIDLKLFADFWLERTR